MCHNDFAPISLVQARALQNWVALTVGLLNRDYKQLQESLIEQQQGYLADRNEFLNSQIMKHDEMMASSPASRPITSSKTVINNEIDKQVKTRMARFRLLKSKF